MTDINEEIVDLLIGALVANKTITWGPIPRLAAEEAINAVAPLIVKQEQERCAKKAQTELENWGIDLQNTSDAYREAAATGKFNGRRVTSDFAKSQAIRFKERADAIYDFGETVAAAIRASKDN